MIVGNGDIGQEGSAVIDAADLVIRFNACRSYGMGGTRTDIVAVCNTGRPGKVMLEQPEWAQHPAIHAATAIWCVRDPAKFAGDQQTLVLTHPELDDFADDYTDGFRTFAEQNGKQLHVIPASTHEDLDQQLQQFHPAPYVVPSSGAVVIAELLGALSQPEDLITLAGFGHQGWEWHPWEAERQWVDGLIAKGGLRRIAQPANSATLDPSASHSPKFSELQG